MPKKTGLATATKPPVDPDKWVTTAQAPSTAGDPIARMTVELPVQVHRALKGKCALEGVKIKKVIVDLVQAYLAGNIHITS
jgi:hypothetical protein